MQQSSQWEDRSTSDSLFRHGLALLSRQVSSSYPPVTASLVIGITGRCHQPWPLGWTRGQAQASHMVSAQRDSSLAVDTLYTTSGPGCDFQTHSTFLEAGCMLSLLTSPSILGRLGSWWHCHCLCVHT